MYHQNKFGCEVMYHRNKFKEANDIIPQKQLEQTISIKNSILKK